MENEWPRLDPITKRMICFSCWEGVHYHELMFRKGLDGKMQNYYEKRDRLAKGVDHACDGECDCVHRSEETWAAIEKQNRLNDLRQKKKNLRAQLEDPSNPLVIR